MPLVLTEPARERFGALSAGQHVREQLREQRRSATSIKLDRDMIEECEGMYDIMQKDEWNNKWKRVWGG